MRSGGNKGRGSAATRRSRQPRHCDHSPGFRRVSARFILPLLAAGTLAAQGWCDEPPGAVRFRERVQPILESYCYGCHGYGSSEGGRTLDEFASDESLLSDVDLWWAVMRNVRAKTMPPADEDHPADAERLAIREWIKADVFGIDPADPDPGRVTIRRLNRVEYRNTIRDLMGVEYDTHENFPADDSGYGFDNIGDVLTLSPLLMEKYIEAAETIVAEAVPTVSKVVAENVYRGGQFRSEDGTKRGNELSFYEPAVVTYDVPIEHAAKYRLVVEVRIDGYWELDPGRCEVTFEVDGEQRFRHEYDWRDDLLLTYEFEEDWEAGEHPMRFELKPLVSEDEKIKYLNFRIERIRIQGPLDKSYWVPPKNYARFFPQGPPPKNAAARDEYAREVLRAFARRAFRRPVDDQTVDRLTQIAKTVFEQPDKRFEEGIAQAMVAVLASPRFLFRVEAPDPSQPDRRHPFVDQYALASRLSYFLWSTMPDEELMSLAERGELRDNLDAQVERMLADEKSQALVEDFTGQWLQARDVEIVVVDPVAALGFQKEWEALMKRFRELRRRRHADEEKRRAQRLENNDAVKKDADDEPEDDAEDDVGAKRHEGDQEFEAIRKEFRRLGKLQEKFNGEVRWAMRRETEMAFEYVMREDRNILELVDSDYTFLNEKLAEHYGISGVEGNEMRRVMLPEGSPRGGLLTEGTLLVVTSNPTRTSPVKRGLFILDNILGTPAPPPPMAVPPLEASAESIADHEPTLREALELHRTEPLCHACHARMDPLGLALENFNAIGMWRETEHDQPIDTSGTLITGESFKNIWELKKVLKTEHRLDFYRCLTEKMLTYALGRGLEYYDEYTVDRLVQELDQQDGRFSALLSGIIHSAPFQRQRRAAAPHADQQASGAQPSIEEGIVP